MARAVKKGSSTGGVLEYGQELSDNELTEYIDLAVSEAASWKDDQEEEIRTAYRQYAGRVLTVQEQAYVDDEMKRHKLVSSPVVNLNLAVGIIDTVVGNHQAQRMETKILGLSGDNRSDLIAELLTRVDRALVRTSKSDSEELQALSDLLIGGSGATETFIDQSVRPPRVVTRHVQPWEIFVDPNAVRPSFADAAYLYRRRRMTVEQAQARWPKHADELRNLLRSNSLSLVSSTPGLAGGTVSGGTLSTTMRAAVYVLDFVYCRHVPKVEYEDPETGLQVVTKYEFQERQAELTKAWEEQARLLVTEAELLAADQVARGEMPSPPPQLPPKPELVASAEFPGKCYYRAWYIQGGQSTKGGTRSGYLLDHKKLPITDSPFVVASGLPEKDWGEERIRYFGLGRIIQDLQRYLSKAISLYLEIIGRGAKGGGFIEQGAVPEGVNHANFVKDLSMPGMWKVIQDGALGEGKIQERGTQPAPNGLERIFNVLLEMIPRTTGVTEWLSGTATNERSNVLISNLQQQAVQMLEPLLREMTALQVANARLRLKMAQLHLADEQLLQAVGEIKPEEGDGVLWVIEKDPETGQETILDPATGQPLEDVRGAVVSALREAPLDELTFDMQIGPFSPYAKTAVWMVLEQGVMKALFEAIGNSGLSALPLLKTIVRALPLPGTASVQLANEYEDEIEQMKQMQTANGIIQAVLEQGEQGAMQILQAVVQAFQGQQPGQAPGAQPPQ